MADEARLNELLDLVEQARAEGDTATEQKAIAAYKSANAPAPAKSGNFLDRMDAALGLGGTQGATELDKWKNAATNVGSAIVRPLAQAVAAPGNMVADFGLAVNDLAQKGIRKLKPKTLSDLVVNDQPKPFQSFSDKFNTALDSVTRPPETTGGRVAEGVNSMLMGMALPSPKFNIGNVPANFVKPTPDLLKQMTLQRSQDAGYVVPPSTTNPSGINRILESLGGKIATEQDASTKNMEVTNALVRKALGLPEGSELSSAQMIGLRGGDRGSGAYKAIRGAGDMVATDKFKSALDSIVRPFVNANKDFPGLVENNVVKVADTLRKESFDSSSAIDAIDVLRGMADKAYGAQDKASGKAFKAMANALEDVIDQNLSKTTDSADMLQKFREARKLIAQTYSVEEALNPATGNVSAVKLGQQLTKGKPLDGALQTAGRFGQAFPKAAREIADSGSVRNTDVILGGATAALSKQPSYLLYPFARQGARELLLSKAGQSLAKKGDGISIPLPILQGLLGGQQGFSPLLK